MRKYVNEKRYTTDLAGPVYTTDTPQISLEETRQRPAHIRASPQNFLAAESCMKQNVRLLGMLQKK